MMASDAQMSMSGSSISTVSYKGYEFTVDDNEPGVVTVAKVDRVYVGDQLVYVRPWNDAELEVFKGYLYRYLKGKHSTSVCENLTVSIKAEHCVGPSVIAERVAAEIRKIGNPKIMIDRSMDYRHSFDAQTSSHIFSFTVIK